ncbi:flavodoxin domain-containing protein [Nocardia sp. NPDC049220]|uniref:flavodoxin domain-containing protein n=1 Tax=Nocardia sp. NPDC049220 TaxID=3155273 RepID=UPI0033E671D7
MESNAPRVAVLYATAQGSTRDIAEFIAAYLTERGADVEAADVHHAPDLSNFGAVVLGSAVHDMDLLPAATAYTRAHRDELSRRDLWIFSVGLSPALQGPIGRRIGPIVPKRIAALCGSVYPWEYRAFAGHYDGIGVSWKARMLYRLMGGGRYGDLRDWTAIRDWSDGIARGLGLRQPATTALP